MTRSPNTAPLSISSNQGIITTAVALTRASGSIRAPNSLSQNLRQPYARGGLCRRRVAWTIDQANRAVYSRTLYGHVAGRMFAGLSSHPASDVVDPSLQQSCSSLQSFILASQTPEHEPTGRHRAKLPDPMNPRPNFSSNSVENESGPRETAPVLRAPAGAQGANAPGRVDVVIITLDEELNLPHCLASLQGWTRDVFVVDSGSTDRTRSLAEELGALFTHQDWLGYAKQRNWAIENLPLTAPWTLVLDADEVISNALRKEIERRVELPPQEVAENGFFINRLSYFLDQPIRHCGYFPSWNMRLFRAGVLFTKDVSFTNTW